MARHETDALLIGARPHSWVAECVAALGLRPRFCDELQQAVEIVRADRPGTVVVSRRKDTVDSLELVLNIREMAPALPVIVLGPAPDCREDRILSSLPFVKVVPEPDRDALHQHIENLLG